jgi:hypothetical protein
VFNVCPGCGEYAVEKAIDPAGPLAVCPACGHRHPFRRLPLFAVTGASGAGKSALCLRLPPLLPDCVVLESDILWRPEFDRPADDYRDFHATWLRLAKNIGQAGRPVVLCGTALPAQLEDQPERRYFAGIHYLALVCDDATLAERLRRRPAWRQSGDDAFVGRMLAFNRWLIANAATTRPPLTLLDTGRQTTDESATAVAAWVVSRWRDDQAPAEATGDGGGRR